MQPGVFYLFLTALTAEIAWLGLAEIDAWGLSPHLGVLDHLFAVVGATPPLVLAWWSLRRARLAPGAELAVLLLGALLLRGVLWFEPLEGTTDAFRYLWDGRVQAAGVNPYLYPPDAPELETLRDEVFFPHLYRAELLTCYPPVAQAWFRLAYRLDADGFFGWKAILLLHELLATALIWLALRRRGLAGAQAVIYALSPLCAVQSMVGMHLDALYAPWLALTFLCSARRPWAAGVFVTVATLVRPLAILALPALMWHRPRREAWQVLAGAGLVGALVTLPFAGAGFALLGSIPTYLADWEFNGSFYWLFKAMTGNAQIARAIGYALLVPIAILLWRRERWSDAARSLAAFGAFYLLAPTVYPWYLVMLLVPWTFVGGIAPLLVGALVMLSDTVLLADAAGMEWRVPFAFWAVEYGGLALVLGLEGWRAWRPGRARQA